MKKNNLFFKWRNKIDDIEKLIKKENICEGEALRISKDIGNGPKRFLITTYDIFFQKIMKIPEEHMLYNEIILSNKEIKFFLDIEGSKKNEFLNEKFIKNFVIDVLLSFVCEKASEIYKIEIKPEVDFIILSSSNEDKFSLHVICNNSKFVFENKQNLYNFVSDIFYLLNERLIEKKVFNPLFIKDKFNKDVELIDIPACKGNSLRIYGSTKYGEKRYLQHWSTKSKKIIKKFDIDTLKNTLLHYITSNEKSLKYEIKYNRESIKPKNELKLIKNENKINLKFDEHSKSNIELNDENIREVINEILNDYYSYAQIKQVPIIKKLFINSENSTMKIDVKNSCVLSIIKNKRGHERETSFFFILSLQYKNIFPLCPKSSCNFKLLSQEKKEQLRMCVNKNHINKINYIIESNQNIIKDGLNLDLQCINNGQHNNKKKRSFSFFINDDEL